MFTKRCLISTCIIVGTMVSPALARDYTYSTYLSPTESQPKFGFTPWGEGITKRTNGDVTIKMFYSGALLPAREGLTGVRDGVADSAQHAISYTPSELPLWNILPDLSFRYPDPLVAAFASTEYGLLDPEGNGEFSNSGVVYLGGYSTPEYVFICRTDDVATLDELKGKRVRTPGGAWSRFVRSIGMVDVNLASTEMYTAFERGAVDCAAADSSHLTSGANLLMVTKAVNDLKMGPYMSGASWIFNKDSWASISPENRKIIFEESAKALVSSVVGYMGVANESRENGVKAGVKIIPPSKDLQAAYDAFVANLDVEMAAAGEKAGLKNIGTEIKDLDGLLNKWQKLLEGVDRKDQEKLTELLYNEVYSKLDENTYGIK